jgi:hypothetical protein
MTRLRRAVPILLALLLATASPAFSAGVAPGFRVEVLVDGRPVSEYRALGSRYIEALKGCEYSIRLHNPLDVRVAVALSVDGLNTIDARRTTARDARKWVVGPHETVTISGWQTSMDQARRFYFTSEDRSYARRLGQADNLGLISAVFFRERVAVPRYVVGSNDARPEGPRQDAAPAARSGAAEPAGQAAAKGALARSEASDEFAATGIGGRTDHRVQVVHLDLEETAAAALDIRYEYRAQLVRLGVLPDIAGPGDPLARRQSSSGFDGRFCPDIK